ncbi:N-methyl-L-tryptophan oxidase [Phycicoccus endophyticus]|uniref:N-methyl-L-tryptophan oxidase n=1 Tax=Phycicoccus endophyticus TaxID=1690220 RepID=A0A7G9QZQ5_9MICO|nr:N-methyl-L-tryptophan oxidase [Phycicoccus endophyticus]NHI20024.1 N-methyl-L-tryptophan oxidase [Phycicoccus endophyticus]QNN48830.1 N-methyl-L-tryptophan oxidase [Phycicoccus endophyticus]GGL42527.1 N-methyltryptophan oxidase [Phycicoccus endophyticus]
MNHPMETVDVAVVGLGALGSAAAYHLARRGARVVAFEQFDLGHVRGASHDTSRIIRTSYGVERYVRLATAAYRDWADFEQAAGEHLVDVTGGVVFIPVDGPYSAGNFARSLEAVGLPHELLSPAQVHDRWPQFRIPENVETVYTPDSGIVNASRTVAALQMQARAHGATLRPRTPVEALEPDGSGVVLRTPAGPVRAGKVVLACDAWTNTLLAPLGSEIPLETMQEQVTYFKPADPETFDRSRFPVWIWEDTHCYYGFPTYGEPTVKAARDVSNNLMTPQERTFEPSAALVEELSDFMRATIPDSGQVLRTVTCQYALTPNREFVLGPLAEHPDILVSLGAGHAFKFAPTIGRVLAELSLDGETAEDISSFVVPPATPVPH